MKFFNELSVEGASFLVFLNGKYESKSWTRPTGQAHPQNTLPTKIAVKNNTPRERSGNNPLEIVNSRLSYPPIADENGACVAWRYGTTSPVEEIPNNFAFNPRNAMTWTMCLTKFNELCD